jgi:tetratricopeptide (TPR) repeat protein
MRWVCVANRRTMLKSKSQNPEANPAGGTAQTMQDASSVIDIRAYRYLKRAHEAWYEQGDFEPAMMWVNKAIVVAPHFVEAILMKADLLYETDNEDEAIDLLDDMLAVTPACLEMYLAKVGMLMALGRFRLALMICQEAFYQARRHKLMQTWSIAYLFRHKITLQMLLHRYWAASQTLDRAIEWLPSAEVDTLKAHMAHHRQHYISQQTKRLLKPRLKQDLNLL